MNAKAIATVLSGKLKDEELIILEKMELAENKTKQMSAVLKKFELKGRILMALADGEKEVMLSSRNLEKVNNISVKQLNVLDMLNNKNLILSKESAKFLEAKYKTADKLEKK